MLHINWLNLLFGTLTVGLFVLAFVSHRRSITSWLERLAKALGAERKGSGSVVGTRDGLRYRIRYDSGFDHSPLWQVEFPDVIGPSFAARRETHRDRSFKRMGFVKEVELGDPELDSWLLIAANEPESLGQYFGSRAVRAALAGLWPRSDMPNDGGIQWIQSGDQLVAMIDVSKTDSFEERIVVLLGRLVQFAAAIKGASDPQHLKAKIPPASLDTVRSTARLLSFYAVTLPVAGVAHSVWAIVFRSSYGGDLRLFSWSTAAAAVAAAASVALSRETVAFHRRLWNLLAFPLAGGVGGLLLAGPLNLLIETPPTAQTVKVTRSESDEVGIFDVWKVGLDEDSMEGILVPWDLGSSLQVGQKVDVVWTRGLLGRVRLLSITPTPTAFPAATP